MKNSIFILLVFIGIQSCKTKDIVVKNGQVVSFNRVPPNGVFINDTLFCDETENANTDYREYLYWVGRVYGMNSQTYQSTLPDTMVSDNYVNNLQENGDSLDNITPYIYGTEAVYFRHPAYNDYPVIGLTYEQAENYSNWRTDRVLEMMLLESKLITPHSEFDSSNYFSVKRYAAGLYFNHKPPKNLYFAKFRLPTIEEWELCAKNKKDNDWGIDSTDKAVLKYKKVGKNLYVTKEVFLHDLENAKQKKPFNSLQIPYCGPIRGFFNYPNHPYGFIGNVAEMTSSKGIAKGGSWLHTLSESKISNNIHYDKPEAWLGFRNVCTWVKLEDFNKK